MKLKLLVRLLASHLLGLNRSLLTRLATQWEFPRATIARTALIVRGPNTRLTLEGEVIISDFSVLLVENDTAGTAPVPSSLSIGEGTYIGQHNNIRASGGAIIIGRKCLISQGISIVASNHSIERSALIQNQPWSLDKTGVTIGDDVWIGANAVILPGVRIDNGAVIGAGSVVTHDVPEYTIVTGVPARVHKQRV